MKETTNPVKRGGAIKEDQRVHLAWTKRKRFELVGTKKFPSSILPKRDSRGRRITKEGTKRKKEDFIVDRRFSIEKSGKYTLFFSEMLLKGVQRVVSSLIPVIRFPLNGFRPRCVLRGVEQ